MCFYNYILSTFLCLLLTLPGSSQVFVDETELEKQTTRKPSSDGTGQTFLDLRLGASIPFGSFSSTDLSDSTSGYALTGNVFEILVRYKFSGLLSGTIGFVTQSNRFDARPFEQSLAEIYNPVYPGLRWQSEAGTWLVNSLVLGLGAGTNSKPVELEAQVLGGIAFQRAPDIKILASNSLGYLEFYQTEDKDISPILGFRGDAAYHFDRLRLGLFVGLWLSEGSFSSDLFINGNYINSGSYINRFYTFIVGLNLSLRMK
jgi:hypothetical protein